MECFFLGCGTVAVDLRGDCVDWIPSRSSDQNTMKAPQPELRAIPQFDCGRWKLRLERVPVSANRQLNGPLVSSIAVGFTMLSPLVFLLTAYLWARVIG